MSSVAWGIASLEAAIALIAAGWLVASTWTPANRAARVAAESRRLGIEVPADLEEELARGAVIRTRAIAIGLVVGVVTGFGATLLLHPSPNPLDFWVGVLVAAVIVGASVAVAAVLRPRPSGGPRIARSRRMTFTDYLSAWELIPTRVLPALAVAGGATAVAVVRDPSAWLALAIAAIAVIAELVFELVGRRLLAQGQPAREPLELAWDDGIRSDALRQMASSAQLAGLLALISAAAALLHWLAVPGWGALLTGFPVLILLWSHALRRLDLPRYYLRRLWPDVPRVPAGSL